MGAARLCVLRVLLVVGLVAGGSVTIAAAAQPARAADSVPTYVLPGTMDNVLSMLGAIVSGDDSVARGAVISYSAPDGIDFSTAQASASATSSTGVISYYAVAIGLADGEPDSPGHRAPGRPPGQHPPV